MYITLTKADIAQALLKLITDKVKPGVESNFELVTEEGTVPLFDIITEVRVELD